MGLNLLSFRNTLTHRRIRQLCDHPEDQRWIRTIWNKIITGTAAPTPSCWGSVVVQNTPSCLLVSSGSRSGSQGRTGLTLLYRQPLGCWSQGSSGTRALRPRCFWNHHLLPIMTFNPCDLPLMKTSICEVICSGRSGCRRLFPQTCEILISVCAHLILGGFTVS